MNVNLLIDAIVRQTMVLIAQLATSAGVRSPLAHLANQVFLDLVHELQEQGLGRKVIADMFGIALRTYHAKMQRVAESVTMRGRSLWEAIYEFIESEGTVSRARVLQRFRNDDGATVRGVLRDLVKSGLVTCTGRGDGTVYRKTSDDELGAVGESDPQAAATALVWVVVHRHAPIDHDELMKLVRLDGERLEAAIVELEDDGRIVREKTPKGTVYSAESCVIPVGSPVGWEAALFDHYQAMVSAMCAKLRTGGSQSSYQDAVGGSTYTIDLWRGHPLEPEVMKLLQDVRRQVTELRERVEAEPKPPSLGPEADLRVLFYSGQTVIGIDEEGD